MFRKLLNGFLFGTGFTAALIIVFLIVSTLDLSFINKTSSSITTGDEANYEEQQKWRALPETEKISNISGLAILRFKESKDKHMEAYVETVLTKSNPTNLPLKIGERVKKSDYYAKDGHSRNRNGILVIYSGNPAKEVEGAFLYEDRLVSYQDMPLEVFLKKFKDNSGN